MYQVRAAVILYFTTWVQLIYTPILHVANTDNVD